MKKQIVALGVAAVMAVSLAACGGSAGSGEIILGQYKGIRVGQSVKDQVTEELIQQNAETSLKEYGTLVDTGKPAEKGNTINMDYVGYVDGEAFSGGSAAKQSVVLGSSGYISGFDDQIVGHSAGETFDIHVTFPENYGRDELDGKDATFSITLNSVQELQLPELTDEFVAENFGKLYPVNTVDEFYDYIEQQLIYYVVEEAITKDLLASCEVTEWPEGKVDELYDDTMDYYTQTLYSKYKVTLETYYTTLGYTEETFTALVRSSCEDTVKTQMMAQKIADIEKIEVSDEEYQTAALQIADSYDMSTVEEAEKEFSKDEMMSSILQDKVFNWIVDHVEYYDDSDETVTTANDADDKDSDKETEADTDTAKESTTKAE